MSSQLVSWLGKSDRATPFIQIRLGAEGPIREDAAGFPVEVPSVRAAAAVLMGTIQLILATICLLCHCNCMADPVT